MKILGRRMLSFILVLVMVLGMLPAAFAAEEEPVQSITVDFAEFVREASKQAFWDDFAAAKTKKGNELTRIGAAYQKIMSADEKAAYQELLTWTQEHFSWSINEEKSGFAGGDGNRLYFNTGDRLDWALCHHVRFYNSDDKSDLALDVTAPAAGWYRLELDAYKQGTSDADPITDADGGFNDDPGAGYLDIFINGKLIVDEVETKGANTAQIMGLGAVYLEEGTNTVELRTAASAIKASIGTSYHGRCGIYLNSMSFVPLDKVTVEQYRTTLLDPGATWLPYGTVVSADTHSVVVKDEDVASALINASGKLVVEGLAVGETELDILQGKDVICTIPVEVSEFTGSMNDLLPKPIVLDFMAFAKEIAKQDFYDDLTDAKVEGIKVMGTTYYVESTQTEKDAYEAVKDWLAENECWNFDEGTASLLSKYTGRRIFINNSGANYGLRVYTQFLNIDDGRSSVWFSVKVPEGAEGVYSMDINYLQEAISTAIEAVDGAEGGGIAHVYVNGQRIYTEHRFGGNPDNTVVEHCLGQVYLKEGSNTVEFDIVKDARGETTNARRALNLRSITFTPMFGWELSAGAEKLLDLRDTYLSFDADVSALTVSSSDNAVSARFDEDSNLLISANKLGKAELTVKNGDETVCTIPVSVTENTNVYSKLEGNKVSVEHDGWYSPVLSYYAQPNGADTSIYLDDAYLGTVSMKADGKDLETVSLRPVYLGAGTYELEAKGAKLQALELTAIAEPELTLFADDCTDKPKRVMETEIRAKWFSGLADDLVDAKWEVEVSDDALLLAEIAEDAPVLQIIGLKPGEGTVTVTADLGGAEASVAIHVTVLNSAALSTMDVYIKGVDKGIIAKNTNQPLTIAMVGTDGDVILPKEAEISYSLSSDIVSVDEENHILRGTELGDVTVTVTATAGGVTLTDTLELTVAEVGENRWSDRNSYFEEGTGGWYGFRDPTEDGFYAAVVEDGAAKIILNPAVSYKAGNGSNELSLANGQMAALEPGHIYEITYRLKVEGYKRAEGAQNDPRLIVQVYDYDSNYRSASPVRQIYASQAADYAALTDGEWYTFTLPVYAPIDTDHTIYAMPRITYDMHYATPTDGDLAGFEGTFWIDDVQIREVSFGYIEPVLSETMTTITRPAAITWYPYTNTGTQIRLDPGILEGNVALESTNEDVVRVVGDMYIPDGDYEYPAWKVQLVGLNAEAELSASFTIGDETRTATLDMTQTNLSEVLRDVRYTLDGFDSAVLKKGETAVGCLTGRTTHLTGIAEDEFASVYFTSDNTKVATVDPVTGDITCVGEGTATITAYGLWDGQSKKDTAIITVTDDTDLTAITLTPNVTYVAQGNSLQMYVQGTKASGGIADMSLYPVAWSVDDEQIASIDENGRLHGLSEGAVTVTATIGVQRKAVTASAEIQVIANEDLEVGGINLVFNYGGAFLTDDPTLEKDGYAINYERCYLGGKNLIRSYSGYEQKVPNGGVLAMDLMVKKSGWYQLEVRGRSLYYLGNLNNVFMDESYMGDVDYGSNVTSNYEGGGVLNAVYLEAGVHHLELVAQESGRTQFISRIALHPVDDPNEVAVTIAAEKTELVTGESVLVGTTATDANGEPFYLRQCESAAEYTNYHILANSNPEVASFDGTTLTALTPGETTITLTGEVMGEAVTVQKTFTVKDASFVSASLEAERTTVRPEAEPFALMLTAYGLGGAALEAIPETVSVTYESADLSVAAVSSDGIVTLTGELGSAEITATLTEGDRTVEATIWITVTAGKTEPTVFTYEERAIAQENVLKYDWAWGQKEAAVKKADYYVEHLDQIYDSWIAEGLPRNTRVGRPHDDTYNLCRYCGSDLIGRYGHYPYIVDPIENPWKITCPDCKRDFPSNDFGAYYASGLDEQRIFHPELADKSLLTNDLYPEMGEGWGVDDGFGYDTGLKDADGTQIIYTFIAHYNACIYWGLGGPDDHSARDIFTALQNAYLYTGDEKYGNAGAILVDRLADVYPDYDLRQYEIYDYSEGDGDGGNGKFMGMIWEGIMIKNWAKACDAFWDCMDNPEVVDYLKARATAKGLTSEDITPEYIRDHVEQNVLLEIFKAVKENQANGNTGMEESGLAYAAVAIGHEPERSEMLGWLNAEDTKGGTGYSSYHTGAGLLRMLVEDVGRDGICHEGSLSYAALWDSQFLDLADALKGIDGFDLWENQKFVNMYVGMMRITVLGNQSPQTQETSAVYQGFPSNANVERMLTAFINTGNRDIARAIYARNGNSVNGLHGDIFTKDPENGIRTQIQQIVNEDGVWDMSRSNMLCGYGIAILREGPEVFLGKNVNGKEFSDYWMSFSWSNIAHTQLEALNIDVEAFGLTLSGGTMGYPMVVSGSDPNRMQWMRNTVSHNCVVVNDRGQDVMYENGFPLHFDDAGKAKVIDVEAPEAYNETDIYRRTLVAVDNGDGVHYAVDFFRILGGSEHVYSFHGATRIDPKLTGLTMTEQPFGTYAGADIPFGADTTKGDMLNSMSGYSWLYNVSRDNSPEATFSVDWQIEDFNHRLVTSDGIHLKLTMLSEEPMTEVALADGQPPQDGRHADHVEFMLARRSGEPGMDTLFTTVIEPYQYESYIAAYELVDMHLIDGTEGYNDRAAAIKTTLKNGRVDYILYATNPDCSYEIDGKFSFRGFTGVVSYENGQIVYAWGNEATQVADVIEEALPKVTGTVTDFTKGLSMDGYTMTIAMNTPVTEEELKDRYIYVNNDGTENAAYCIYDAEVNGNVAVLDLRTQTLTREMVSDADPKEGFLHNIEVGQTYTIPLSASFDIGDVFHYTTDTVVRAGNKLSLSLGTGTAFYEAEGLVAGMKLDSRTGTLTWTTSKTNVGKYPVTVKAVREGDVVGTMSFVIYVVSYTGSTYAPDKCSHSKSMDFGTEIVCPACGTITKKAVEDEEEIKKFDIVGSNMTLGNELKLNVLVKSDDLGEGAYTAKITHNGVTTEAEVTKYNSNYHAVTVSVAAKQMTDIITVEVYDENGNVVSNPYEISVRAYAMKVLANTTMTAKVKTLVVDMLNYGAEAQLYFKYNDADLANSLLTAEQKALATEAVTCTNRQVKGTNFYGTNLSLEDCILLNLFFKNVKDGYTAKVIFTDFRGQTKTVEKELIPYSGSLYEIVVDDIVLADAFTTVTATVYDGDGNVVGSATDSVESYIARTGDSALNEAIMKFAYSAKQYLS